MNLTHWFRAIAKRIQKSSAPSHRAANTIELGLMRLEDRRVLSVSGGELMLFSVGGTGVELPDVGYVNTSDIISYDGDQFALFFKGSEVGLAGADIDGFAVKGENQFLFSFASTTTIDGVGTFNSSDVLLFEADTLGANTAGTFSLFLRGADLGLTGNAGNIDALDLLEDGTLVFSTAGHVTLRLGESGELTEVRDADLVRLTPDADGNYGTGTMDILFRGSNADLTFSSEDINAVSIDGFQVRLSTLGSVFIDSQGIGGSRDDVLTFNATSFGEDTSGTYVGVTFKGVEVTGTRFSLNALDFTTVFTSSDTRPTAQDFSVEVEEDGAVLVQLLGDDGDENFDHHLTYVIVDNPDFGSISNFDPSTGTFTYVPRADFFGTDQIIYLVQKTNENGVVFTSDLATVTIFVTPVNDPPVVFIEQPQITGDQGVPLVIHGISVDDVEAGALQTPVLVTLQVENGTLAVSDPSGQLQISGNGSSEIHLTGTIADINLLLSQGVTFQPDANFTGVTALIVTIQDDVNPDDALVASGSVQIEILSPPDEPPISFEDQIAELLESGELRQGDAQILLNVLRHDDKAGSAERAIQHVEKWEQQGRLDSDLADELIDWLKGLAEESPSRQGPLGGHPRQEDADAVFVQIGQGVAGRNVGRFRV